MSGEDYFGGIDSFSSHPQYFDIEPDKKTPSSEDAGLNFKAKSIGATTDPFGNTLNSLKARIREGVSRVEFNFINSGSGNSQQVTPEMFGSEERRDMRELLKVNKMKGSVHAPVLSDSLAGFDPQQGGFSEAKRENVMRNIKRSIDFASEATRGGAVVFHMHEWQRPLSEIDDKDLDTGSNRFRTYEGESDESVRYVVDKRNGQVIRGSGIRKDTNIYRPQYRTAADEGLVGKKDPNTGKTLQEDDWVDIEGNHIPRGADPEELFRRVPKFDPDSRSFEVEKLEWDDLVKEAERNGVAPEVEYARTQLENQALQARGSSLMYGQNYLDRQRKYTQLKDRYEQYKEAKERLPEDEQWKAEQLIPDEFRDIASGEGKSTEEIFKEQLDTARFGLTHIHQQSGSADVQAKEVEEQFGNLATVKEYGEKKTAETIASAAHYAMEVYEDRKDDYDIEDPIYVAPENWNQNFYGSHPEEYKSIIKKSREKFVEQLTGQGYSQEDAKEKAKNHIKGTLDIGHMNTLRSRFKRKDHESLDEYEKRFNDWLLTETKELVDEGYVGHIHLNDNFGYEDEHVTPGEGNIPMKEFLKNLEEADMDDIIVEQGSFNGLAHLETRKLANGPTYGPQRSQGFSYTRRGHFGYRAPAMFIAGSYAPSNDFSLWTETPLE